MARRIKVMRIIARLNIGGPAIHTTILNAGLNRDGYDTVLVAGLPASGEGDMTYLAREKGLRMKIIPEFKRNISPWHDAITLWKLFRIIGKERPDIVHTHTAKAGALGRCAAILNRAPLRIHSFHGHVFNDYFNPIATKIFVLIEKIFARFTDRLVVVSDLVKNDICDKFKISDPGRVSVVRLGLDLEKFGNAKEFKGQLRKELNIGEDALLVGIAGRITPIKNHRLLFDAAGLVKDKEPGLNIIFLVIGDGELRQELADYAAKLGIADRVYFLGWRRDMPRIYADLDIVALTSLNEGTPLSLIEAMASGRAVVATAVGGVPDIIQDGRTGILVESNNAVWLKDAMLTLCRDKNLRDRIGGAAYSYIHANYSGDRLVRDIENIYDELVKKRSI